jgi:hypothetical protein
MGAVAPLVPIGEILVNAQSLPEDSQTRMRHSVSSSAFRSLATRHDQIIHLRERDPPFPYAEISVAIGVSIGLISKVVAKRSSPIRDNLESQSSQTSVSPPRQYLTIDEENSIIRWIVDKHAARDCVSPAEVRAKAEKIYFARTKNDLTFSVDWWKSFKIRHAEKLAVKTCNSLETKRACVPGIDVCSYYAQVIAALTSMRSHEQMLNMDETGLSVRPDKGRQKKCVYSVGLEIEPRFREENDISHITLVGTVSLSCTSLPSLILTTSEIKFKSQQLRDLENSFWIRKTPKGYMNRDSMAYYIAVILRPYCAQLRERLGDPTLPVWLIMDNHSSHNREELMEMFAQAKIYIIWLPPHSTHFLQVLDLLLFGIFKRNYKRLPKVETNPKIEGKIVRALHAWHESSWPPYLRSAWRMAGFHLDPSPASDVWSGVNLRKIAELIIQNCPDQGRTILDFLDK